MEDQTISTIQEIQNCECRSCLLKAYVHLEDNASINSLEEYNYPLPHDFDCDCDDCLGPCTMSEIEMLEQQRALRRVQLDRIASFVDTTMDRLDYENQPQDENLPQDDELDNYDEVPCHGCGEPVPREEVNVHRHGWWCSRDCAFWQWM